jgi:hypothetical protein
MWGLLLLAVNQLAILPLFDPALLKATSGGVFIWWVLSHVM